MVQFLRPRQRHPESSTWNVGGDVSPTCETCGTILSGGATVRVRVDVAEPELETEAVEAVLRGRLFQELDLLAYALEMEASEALLRGDEAEAGRAQQTRLGIRLAQRLVGAVPAPEIELRLQRWRERYLAKFPAESA